MTAHERKSAVLAAALKAFAQNGYGGTSTEAIAEVAGISQPYLFRLFGTKKQLFLETVALGCQAILRTFAQASEGLEGEAALEAMGAAYAPLIVDRDLLLIQIQGYAASGDPEIRAFTSSRFREIVEFVAARTGLGPQPLREFFAMGMLCNVVTALDLGSLDELWGDWRVEPERAAFVDSLGAMRA
ncbi:MAG: TetR/AcrR family transcriptional regulator [Acidimicrobiales bacterium]